MIKNAKDVSLDSNPGTLPNVQAAMLNWFQKVTFILIEKSVVNSQLVEVETPIIFQGVVESISGQDLLMKPEGQRQWNWQNVWAYPDLVLSIDDILSYQGIRYRVMKKNDWAAYGYLQYDLVEDYVST